MSNKEGLFDDSGDEEEMYKPTTEENKAPVVPDTAALAEVGLDDEEDTKKEASAEPEST